MIHQLRITRLEKLQKVRQRSRQNDMEIKQAQQVSDSTGEKKKMYKHEHPRKHF